MAKNPKRKIVWEFPIDFLGELEILEHCAFTALSVSRNQGYPVLNLLADFSTERKMHRRRFHVADTEEDLPDLNLKYIGSASPPEETIYTRSWHIFEIVEAEENG